MHVGLHLCRLLPCPQILDKGQNLLLQQGSTRVEHLTAYFLLETRSSLFCQSIGDEEKNVFMKQVLACSRLMPTCHCHEYRLLIYSLFQNQTFPLSVLQVMPDNKILLFYRIFDKSKFSLVKSVFFFFCNPLLHQYVRERQKEQEGVG